MNYSRLAQAIVFAFCFSLVSPVQSHALIVSAVLTGNLTAPSVSSFPRSGSYSASLGVGVGALVDLPIGGSFTLQPGLLYVTRAFSDDQNNRFSVNGFQIPVLLRYWLIPMVSVGIGGQLTAGVGNVAGSVYGSGSYTDYLISSSDYGLLASVNAVVPLSPWMGITADVRYGLGLSNQALNNPASFKYNDLQLLAGLALTF